MQILLLLALLFNLFIKVPASLAGTSYTDQSYYLKLNETEQKYWSYLLHTKDSSRESKFNGEKYFLSANGKNDPIAEFNSTVNAFKEGKRQVGWFNYPVQCVFRERYEFIKKMGLLENAPVTPCPMFEEWKKGLNADSVTFIFSSSYPNNPSSLFGHTLIRLNQKNKKNDLLDYSVSFSAMPEKDDIGVIFALKGMFGGYKGLIDISKFYTKVNDYTNSESRDLIEYNLNLNNEQLDRLINHIWEIFQTTYLDYYFFDENCSSVLADILGVALFEIPGIKTHSKWYYLPSELVKVLNAKPNLVQSVKYRPSLKKQLEKKLENLSVTELKEVKSIKISGNLENDYSNIKVLDALISTLDYRRYFTKYKLSDSEKILMRKSLIQRSSIGGDSPEYDGYSENNRPELGHESRNLQSFVRSENAHILVGVNYKNGYHNLMSRDLGFDDFSEFDFLTGSIAYDTNLKKMNYDEFKIVHLTSLHVYTFYDPQFSWDAGVGLGRFYQNNCEFCHQFDARAIGGLTFKPLSNLYANIHGGAFFELNSHVHNGYRVGPAAEISLLMNAYDLLKFGAFEEMRFHAADILKKNFQNISKFKMSYIKNMNSDLNLEFKSFSRIGSFKEDTQIVQLTYGKYF